MWTLVEDRRSSYRTIKTLMSYLNGLHDSLNNFNEDWGLREMSSSGHYENFQPISTVGQCGSSIQGPAHKTGTKTWCQVCREQQAKQEFPWGGNTPVSPEEPFLDIGTSIKKYSIVETKDTNPKELVGSNKVPMGLVPPVTSAYLAIGHLEGDLKYGRANWREAGVKTMTYIDAAKRHIDKFRDGQWEDPQTHVPHLANALACVSIIIDAYHAKKLVDDRPKSVDSASVIDGLSEVVQHLRVLHKDMKPVDYFINGPKERE
jgi:hypothetical protein